MNHGVLSVTRFLRHWHRVLLCLLLLQCLPIPAVWGQSPTSPPSSACHEIELVFIIDQSGSMGGSISHPTPNDPQGFRFSGPKFAVDLVGRQYLTFASQNIPGETPSTFHIAVVYFGDQAQTVMPWSTLAPKDNPSWQALRNPLLAKISSSDNLGETNFLRAFDEAANLFNQRPPPVGGCPQRAVMVLTDGEPAVSDDPAFSVDSHMSTLETKFPPDYRIYVTAVNDPGSPYWSRVSSYWERISHDDPSLPLRRTALIGRQDDINARFTQILLDLAGQAPRPNVPLGRYVVPPYLQELCLVLYKQDAAEHLDISDLHGTRLSHNPPGVDVSGYDDLIESLCVQSPKPGEWNVQTTSGRADVRIHAFPILTAGRLTSPKTSTLQYQKTTIAFQLVDSQQVPLPDYPAEPHYQLTITATVQAAGRVWDISNPQPVKPQVSRPVTDTRQAYETTFIPVESGTHEVHVHALSHDIDGKTISVMKGKIGDFFVDPVTLQVLSDPTSPGRCPNPQQGLPMEFAYRLQDPASQPVTTDIPLRWTAEVGGGGAPVSLSMQPVSTGVYSTTFFPQSSGPYTMQVTTMLQEPIGGTEQQIFARDYAFEVKPTQKVALTLAHPQPGNYPGQALRLQWKPPFVRLEPEPLDINVELVEPESGKPLDITRTKISPTPPDQLLDLRVQDTTTGNLVPISLAFHTTGRPGELRAQVTNLNLAEHIVRVEPSQSALLNCGWAWDAKTPDPLEVKIVQDPRLYWLYGAILLLIALLAAMLYWRWAITHDACKGYLVIHDHHGHRVPGASFDLAGRNRHTFKKIPGVTGVRRLDVWKVRGAADDYCIKVRVVPLQGPVPRQGDDNMLLGGSKILPNNYRLLYVRSLSSS
ncbi:MAG: VWA domain-containing protein [Chloroflexaceae bacterium]|nr:VWA domain-containing protein [Chloroflexaceae bacterium]